MALKLKFIKDICNGMLHLSSEGILHKDLGNFVRSIHSHLQAARNVLITGNLEAKVSDFGLSRLGDASDQKIYVSSKDTGPVK